MNQSTPFEVEDALARLIEDYSSLNAYTTSRTGKRLFPYVTISASINTQLLGNYTGVYDLSVAVNYSDTSVKVTQEDFDSEYCQIFESLYEETPALVNKIQNRIIRTKIYMARITSQTPTIRTDKRAWQRGLTLNIFATPSEAGDGIRNYDFSDQLNSFYIATI